MLPIVHHADYDAHFPAEHRFPMGKYGALMRRLSAMGLAGDVRQPEPAPPEWLGLAHDPAYVGQVLSFSVPPKVEREIGFPVSERVSRRAQLATGGTVLAARLAMEHGIALNTAGGSHHARFAQGAGFCTFNDVAVAARLLVAEGRAKRVLVVDLDVHQGDGSAEILSGDDAVFTFSMHGERNYPVRKRASDWDIGLDDGTDDLAYLQALDAALERLVGLGGWDIVFYNAGVDPHREDRLGRLCLSDEGLARRDRLVINAFRALGIPIVGVIGGGYCRDVEALAARHAIVFEMAAGFA